MLRTELDALPVAEKTGLPFASTVTTKNAAGQLVPVMHACGHDLHMSAWAGTARIMAEHKASWRGTLMLVGQPAEETLSGAVAMLEDGLFTRFPRPDFALVAARRRHDAGGNDRLPRRPVPRHVGSRRDHRLRTRRTRGDAAQHDRPDRPRLAHRPLAADDRLAREQSGRSGGDHRRVDSRRHAGQRHSRRSEAGTVGAHADAAGADENARRNPPSREGRSRRRGRAARTAGHRAGGGSARQSSTIRRSSLAWPVR